MYKQFYSTKMKYYDVGMKGNKQCSNVTQLHNFKAQLIK